MGVNWISQRTNITVIVIILHIQALLGVRTTVVSGVEGQGFDFRCAYPREMQDYLKYFCCVDDNEDHSYLTLAKNPNQWERKGRFSLYDNTTGAFFIVRMDELISNDSGMYVCGVKMNTDPDRLSFIKLNVSRVTAATPSPIDPSADVIHMKLVLIVVIVGAMLSVCLFSFCLLLVVKNRTQSRRQNSRKKSSDYEMMMPGTRPEPDICCSCADLSALPPLPPTQPPRPSFCTKCTPKQRESTQSLNHGEYADIDIPGHISEYHHLDLSQLEEHVYHSLQGSNGPKRAPSKKHIKC